MYYKIENKKSTVYKQLHAMRLKEHEIEKENRKAIDKKTGLKYKVFLGHRGQQQFRRVTEFTGFQFLEPEKVDLKVWRKDKEHPEVFVPNIRTAAGREMQHFLSNELASSWYDKPLQILKLEKMRKFIFPYVEIAGEVLILFLGDDHQPKDKNVIEITSKEFEKLRKAAKTI